MKLMRTVTPLGVFLLVATGAFFDTQRIYAQHEEEKQAKPENHPKPSPQQRPQPRAQQPKPSPEQPRAQQNTHPQKAQPQEQRTQPEQRAQQPQKAAQQPQRAQQHAQVASSSAHQTNYALPQRTRQQAQTWQKQTSWRQNGAWQAHSSWQQDRSSNWQSDHRTWAQRGGYGGFYIPQAGFNLHFGEDHFFRLQSEPIIVGGYPQFQYGGYSFMMVDPWPGDWAANWYSEDDVYVGFDNGYYLYDRSHPGEAIAITVSI